MEVTSAQSFTLHRYFNLKQFTLPVVNLGAADTSGLVADPYQKGVLYRPGVVNPLPSQPAGAPVVPAQQSAQVPVQLPVINLGNADTSGLVVDPRSGVSYRPGVVNIDPSQPASTQEVHNINWGGYGSVQATPQPTQIIDDHYSTFGTTDSAEIFIFPSNGGSATGSDEPAPKSTSIAQSSLLTKGETIDTKV